MRNLLAILFHRAAAPQKSEGAHARKQADSFAKILQSSLRDSNRGSGSGLASGSPALALPETEAGPKQACDAAQDDQADNLLASQPIASPRYDRDKSESQVGPKAAAHDGSVQSPSSQAGDRAQRLQQTHRGYAPSPSRQAAHGDPTSARSEKARTQSSSPKPDAAPASQRSGSSSARPAPATTSLLPEPSVKPGTVDRVQPHPQATTTTPRAAADAAVKAPSGETNMPPNTSVQANTLSSSGVPGSRSDEQVRPHAWKIASEGAPELPIQQACMQATDCAAPAQTPDPVTADPTNLDAAASRSGSQAPQVSSPLPTAEHPLVAKLLAEGDGLVDSDTAPALAPPVSASPEAAAPSGEPIVGSPLSPAMPATNAAEGQAMLSTPTDPEVAGQNASTSARSELTHPSPEPSVPPEVRAAGVPALASRRHPEAPPTRGEQPGTPVSPGAGEPKVEGPHPAAPRASLSLPHTSLSPKVVTSAKPFDARSAAQVRPHHGTTQAPSAPPTGSTIPAGEPRPVPSEPVSRPWPNQKSAAIEVGRAAETTPSSPAAPDFGPEEAKPSAKEITFITQAAIETPQASDSAMSSQPVAPVPTERKATSTPTHPRASARHSGTHPAPVTGRPAREGTSLALRTTPPLRERPKASAPVTSSPLNTEQALPSAPVTSSPLTAEQALPSAPVTSSPLTAEEAGPDEPAQPGTNALDLGLPEKPAAPSLSPAVVAGQDESGRPVVVEPVTEEPTLTPQPVPQSDVSDSKTRAAEPSELVEPVSLAHTSMPESVPSAHTRRSETHPALPNHDTLTSAQSDTAEALPAQPPLDPITPSPTPAPHAAQAPIAASHRGQAMPERPVAPQLNPGQQVEPLAHPKTEPAPLSVESEISTEPAPSLPVVESVPSSGTAPNAAAPQAVHAPRLTGRQSPRAPHPGSSVPQPEKAAKPMEAKLPSSAPQVETQPARPAKTEEEEADEAASSAAPAPTSPSSSTSQPLSSSAQPVVPPLAPTAPTPSDKPMPRSDTSAPAAPVAPATASQAAPGVSQSPALAAPVQAESARTQRRPWSAEDDRRLPQAETSSTPATLPHQARPLTAPAPHANASDKQNSAGDQNPNRPTPAQATPVLPAGNDRPLDFPAPQTPASPSPNDASAIAPAQASAPVVHAPPVEVRSPHLPHPMVPLAAQAARDDGLSMTVMPHVAHMSIESRDGDLALHLRVRDGSADVTVGGSMAPLFEARAPEARAALASEGLNLGRFDLGQQGGGSGGQQGQPAPERHERAPEPATPYRQQSNQHEPASGDGRIHVTA